MRRTDPPGEIRKQVVPLRHSLQGDVVGILDMNGRRMVEYKCDVRGRLVSVEGVSKTTLDALNPFR